MKRALAIIVLVAASVASLFITSVGPASDAESVQNVPAGRAYDLQRLDQRITALEKEVEALKRHLSTNRTVAAGDAIRDATGHLEDLPSPAQIVAAYQSAWLEGNLQAAYQLISAQDRAVKSLSEFEAETATYMHIAQSLLDHHYYEIKDVNVANQRAQVTVGVTQPDWAVLVPEIPRDQFWTMEQGEIRRVLARKYPDGDVPLRTTTETLELVKESDHWRIQVGWLKGKTVAEESQERAAQWKREHQSYIDESLVLYDLTAGYYRTYLDEAKPGVRFKLRNKGDRTLDAVSVIVYFKDPNGTTIHEEQFYPVSSIRSDSKPLKPNYIWQMEAGKFYSAEPVPSEWKEGSVCAEIAYIWFAKEDPVQ